MCEDVSSSAMAGGRLVIDWATFRSVMWSCPSSLPHFSSALLFCTSHREPGGLRKLLGLGSQLLPAYSPKGADAEPCERNREAYCKQQPARPGSVAGLIF